MSGQHPGEGHGHDQLAGMKTLEEILATATGFEKTARDFYTAMIPKVSKRIRYLVEELAAEEQRHYELFSALAADPALQAQIGTAIETPQADHRFSDYVQSPDLGDAPDDQAILQYALYREHAAMEQYLDLARSAPPGPARDLFRWLADEETRHKLELEKTYYQLVHSGGV